MRRMRKQMRAVRIVICKQQDNQVSLFYQYSVVVIISKPMHIRSLNNLPGESSFDSCVDLPLCMLTGEDPIRKGREIFIQV